MKLSDTSVSMLKKIFFIFIFFCVAGFFFKAFVIFLPYLLGLSFGTLFAMFKLFMLEVAVNKSLDMEPHNAKLYIFSQYMLRYFLTGVALFFVITNKNISTLGFLIGLFSLQLSAYITGFTDKKDREDKNQ